MNFDDYTNSIPYSQETRGEYQAEEARLRAQFKADALEDLRLTGHPKADKLMAIAWDMGHSSGYQEVYNYAAELAPLLEG